MQIQRSTNSIKLKKGKTDEGTEIAGSPLWMAPETLMGNASFKVNARALLLTNWLFSSLLFSLPPDVYVGALVAC